MKEWIESILMFMIVSSVVTELVPEESYKTGIRLFGGLILVVLTVFPITEKLFSMELPSMDSLFSIELPAVREDTSYYEELFQNRYEEWVQDEKAQQN